MNEKIRKLNKKRGFTLIETLMAILILTTSVVALTTVASQGVFSANKSVNFNTASYLAQEGIELVRNIRDGNYNNGNFWLEGIPEECIENDDQWCLISVDIANRGISDDIRIRPCDSATDRPENDCLPLDRSNAGDFYLAEDDATGNFIRAVNIVPVFMFDDQDDEEGVVDGFGSDFDPNGSSFNAQDVVDEVRVLSEVHWQQGNLAESVEIQTYMFNWGQ